ncbi:MAG: CARDB domain-containing protein, partial [Candidatus Methanomethylicaceae archaeon]
ILVIAAREDTAPGFKFVPKEAFSTVALQSSLEPSLAVVTVAFVLVALGSTGYTIYEWVTNPDEAPVQIPGILEGSRKVKSFCFQIDASDILDIASIVSSVTKLGKAIKVIGTPAARRGVTAIYLGFTKKQLEKSIATDLAVEILKFLDIMNTDVINNCEYVYVDKNKVEHPIPLLVWDVQANKPPVANLRANPTKGDAPLLVRFDASGSFDPDGRIVAYHWTFGDNHTATTSQPYIEHTYTGEGTYLAAVKVEDDRGAFSTAQISITVTSPSCPDLVVADLWIEPRNFLPGQQIFVWAKIQNRGNANSNKLNISMNIDGRVFDSGNLKELAPREIVTVYSDALVWPDANCHTIAVILDPDNSVYECDEMNNQIIRSFCPDTQCVNRPSVWTDKNEYCIGENVNIYIKVSVPSYVDVWIVYQNGETKLLLQERYLEDPAKTYVLSAKAGQPTGTRTLYVKAKACAMETTVFCQYRVMDCQAPPSIFPNLVIAEFQAWGDTSACPTGKIKFSLIVKNKGNARSGKTTVFVYQEECRVISFGVWSAEVPELPPGEWIPFNGEVEYCNDIGGTAVTLVAVVDPSNTVQESNEGDNTARVRVDNPCSGTLMPDLIITDINITEARQCLDLTDKPIFVCFYITVKNAGSAPSRGTELSFDLYFCGVGEGMYVPPLSPGESVTLSDSAICLVGDATCMDANRFAVLRFVVDPYNDVQEIDESNNVKYIRVYIFESYCL